MDIFSCSLNQPNYKSPRVPLSTDPRTEDTDLKKFPSANATSTSATRIFNSIVKEAGTLSKDQSTNQAQTSKILKSLMNRSHHPDSNRKPEKTNRPPQFNKNGNEFDDPSLRGYEEDPGNDYENHRLSNTQKLPIINHKKQLPRIEANKKLDRLNTLEKHLGSLISPKCDNDLLSSQNRVTTQPHSPSPSKQLKGIWKSPLKNGSEEREYYIDVRNGKVKESASKAGENGNVSGQTVVVRTRFSSGGKILHNNLSGGEEEEGNQDKVGLSLMISSMKGSQRAGQHIKKRTEMWRQVRASSPEIKDNSIDIAELKKVKMKIEQQKNGGKSMAKKKNQDRASSVVYTSGNMGGEINGRNDGGWEKDESEGSDNEEDNFEEKKVEEERNREKNVKRVQQAVKEVKSDAVTTVVSKQAKKLQDHIQISRVGDKEKETAQMKREQAYKEFILRLNFSFNVQVRIPTEKTFTSYKYFLGKGNNSMLIKALMKQRWWWVQVDNKEPSEVNFMWTQLKQNKFIGALKQRRKSPFDNLEWSGLSSSQFNDNNTTSSTPTFIDSLTDCESDTTEGESKAPIKKAKKSQTSKVGKGSAKKEGNDMNGGLRTQEDTYKRLFTNSEISLMNSVTEGKSFYPEDCEEIGKVRKGPSHQVIGDPSVMRMCNHLESNFHLANKKALLWNMKSYYEAIKKNVFDYLPLTFHVRNGFEDPEYQKFVEYYNNREKEIQEQEKLAQESKEGKKNAKKLRNIWIVKPGENTNRGVGIHVCDSLSQINDLVATTEGTDGKRRTYLIQQYLDRPLLYNKRKFDIRCYILMTCINGMMKGYWYQDGYIRTASKEFSLKNVTNKFVHLTNDAIQKKAEDYGKFESGNKVSYNEFQKYLDTHHDGSIDFSNDIYPQIKQLATDAIKGVYGKIDPHRRENSFEVFGLDFMIDTNLRAWLIEVNTNPDINASSPVLTRVIPPMVENALRLTIDQMYPPPAWHSSKKQMLPENMLENNKFELVFDEVEDGPALRSILQADKGATGDLILEIVAEEEEEEDAEEEIKD